MVASFSFVVGGVEKSFEVVVKEIVEVIVNKTNVIFRSFFRRAIKPCYTLLIRGTCKHGKIAIEVPFPP